MVINLWKIKLSEKNNKIRLIQKSSRTFLVTSALLMVLSTVVLFFYVKSLLQTEVEEELFSTEARIETALLENKPLYTLPPVVEIVEVVDLEAQILKDTLIYDPSQDELEEFRELSSFKKVNGQNYKITVRSLVVESDDILIAVVVSYVIIIVLVFLVLFYFNRAWSKKLWSPFFANLEQMKKFSLSTETPMQLVDSDILEFSELNKEVMQLTNKVKTDYKNLKQFTEDVSHELQNPLAIIQAKVENIINGDGLNEVQFEHLTSIQKDIQRLTQMNKRLTLLTKIENNQFVKVKKVNIAKNMGETIQNFQEISSTKINYSDKEDIHVQMDPYLAEILCNNLISNAIKYSPEEGKIEVRTSGNTLSISNQGPKALEKPENLYSRFYRESETTKSTGLGLAIINRICELYRFEISYHFKENHHIFSITF